MNDKIGLLSYRMDRESFDKPYSNETAHMIDTEVCALQALQLWALAFGVCVCVSRGKGVWN